jgi:hypothetical protein
MNGQLPNTSEAKQTRTARPGDQFVVAGHHLGERERQGKILEVMGQNGGPPFLVRWDDGHTSEVFPAEDAYVRHAEARRPPDG